MRFFSTSEAARALGVDWEDDDLSYNFELEKEYLEESGRPSDHVGQCL